MAQPVSAAWLTPDKRYAIALHDDRRTVSVIDAAMGEMAQAFSLSMPLLHLHMIDRTGFLQLANGMVLKFDQASLARGQAVALVPVLRPAPDMDMVADELIPPPALMPFGEGILASGHGGDRIARVTMDTHAALNGAPAQSTPTILRTGRSKAMASVKRGFIEIGPGIYEASFMARAHGAHLLVLADAKGQFSACHAIAIDDGDAATREVQKARLVLVAARSAIAVGASRIVMTVDGDTTRRDGAVTSFEIMDLSSHWRTRAHATRQSDGTFWRMSHFQNLVAIFCKPMPLMPAMPFAHQLSLLFPNARTANDRSPHISHCFCGTGCSCQCQCRHDAIPACAPPRA